MRVQYLCMNKYILFHWFPVTPNISALSPQVSIVDICCVHTAVGSELSQLWSTESGLF